jgi:hypothetical protein
LIDLSDGTRTRTSLLGFRLATEAFATR